MSGLLQTFLEGKLCAPADQLGRVQDELFAELSVLPGFEADFTTPEGAILCLEKAYRDRDIEAAVSAKDFKTEARFLLRSSKFKDFAGDDEMVDAAAKLLELSFREQTLREWPSFEGLESFFPRRTVRGDGIVLVTEV